MTKKFLLWITLFSAVGTLAVQLCALVSLGGEDFGLFSLFYLVAAFALSIQLSTISEAWIRSNPAEHKSDWADYSTVSVVFSLLSGAVALCFAVSIPALNNVAILIFIAVVSTVYRASARFYSLRNEDARGVFWGDLGSMLIAVSGAVVILLSYRNSLLAVVALWATAAFCSALLSRLPQLQSWRALTRWYSDRKTVIKPLLGESLFMDLSAIGTPLLMMPLLGIANFGIYRGVSNVAAPIRIILNPLRPRLSHLTQERISRRSTLAVIALGSVVMGLLAGIVLVVISVSHLKFGTLSSLSVYAIPTALFVCANMFGHTYYMLARQHSPTRVIVVARVVQTGVGVLLPLVGVFTLGLAGAIWGYALATVLSGSFWAYSVISRR